MRKEFSGQKSAFRDVSSLLALSEDDASVLATQIEEISEDDR